MIVLLACVDAPDSKASTPEADEAPVVTFVAPVDGDNFVEQDAVVLTVQVLDDRDAVEHMRFVWTIDGAPLAGTLTTDPLNAMWAVDGTLPTGTHNLGVAATDLGGNETSAQVTVVVAANRAPVLTFVSPADGTEVWEGESIEVDLLVEDEGAVTLAWDGPTTADADGHARFTLADLPAGGETLSVTGTDSLGLTSSAYVRYSVRAYDADQDGYVNVEAGGEDCDDSTSAVNPGATERCDGIDNNCDGDVDSDAIDRGTWFVDDDADGFGDAEVLACDAPEGTSDIGGDCDDARADVFPGATEVCDGVDDNCDGDVDGDAVDASTWFLDADGDDYGTAPVVACDAPAGTATVDGDCDDTSFSVNPGAVERCNDVDDDCDGDADSDAVDVEIWFVDGDADGFGDAASYACDAPAGTVGVDGDCDDTDAAVNPDAVEVCNGADDDCSGDADSDATDRGTWYEDVDGDGYGGAAVMACEEPAAVIDSAGDCDDTDAAIRPDAEDECGDGIDDDCDGADSVCFWSSSWTFDDAALRIDSDDSQAQLGATAVFLPDQDGDGLDDIAFALDQSGSGNGGVRVWSGATRGNILLTDTPRSRLLNAESFQYTGRSLATGDLDGDGVIDLIVGEPDTWSSDHGYVYVLPLPLPEGDSYPADLAVAAWDGYPGDGFGQAVLVLPDMDGDGDDELVIGSDADNATSGSSSIYLIPGGTLTDATAADAAWMTITESYGRRLGGELADAGDVDGDGIHEIAARAIGSGAVYVFRPDAALVDADAADWIYTDAGDYDWGEPLDGAGDLDGDGYDDVVVGNEDALVGGKSNGIAYIVPGDAGRATGSETLSSASLRIYGDTYDHFGVSVEIAGDLDGDGWLDLLVGAETADFGGFSSPGGIFVFNGPLTDGLTSDDATATLVGDAINSDFGETLEGGGDVDGDGFADFLTGAPAYGEVTFFGGAAFLVRGAPR